MTDCAYAVVMFASTSHAIRAERILDTAGISNKLITVPRHLSSDCGVCLRIDRSDVEAARAALSRSRVQVEGIHLL